MSDPTFIVVIVMTFGFIYFIDLIFKSCLFYPYLQFLHRTGIVIQLFAIKWESSRFNRTLYKWSTYKPTFLRMWFQTGTIVAMICMIPAFCLISYSFWQTIESSLSQLDSKVSFLPTAQSSVVENAQPSLQATSQPSFQSTSPPNSDGSQTVPSINKSDGSRDNHSPILMPIIPGLTLPFSQILFYMITLLLSMVVHEMGHAIACSRENVAIEGIGIGLYFLVFPYAYVKLPSERLNNLLPWQQLRIFCAGIWHNIVLSAFALLLLWCNPLILLPAFNSGNGVTVINVQKGSAISQPGGLEVTDQVFDINGCEVKEIHSWGKCLEDLSLNADRAFCGAKNFIKFEDITSKDENTTQCCPDLSQYLCFKHVGLEDHFCLPGRGLVEHAKMCNTDEDCDKGLCLVPVLSSSYDKFLKIKRRFKNSVLYIGTIQELQSTVTVSTWNAKYKAVPVYYAEIYETLLIYIVTFSSGLAIMNVIPCYGLDGAYLTEILVHYYLSSLVPKFKHRNFVIMLSNFLGLFMLCFSIFHALVNYYM